MSSNIEVGTIARAPGKLVLAGEYAVLDGAPSLVMAINRGVECVVTAGTGIQTPNNDTRFVDELREASAHAHFHFRDWNPVETLGSDKPGFGGSAAACVVAMALLGKKHLAVEMHKKIQGSGSGIDVLASIHGGCFLWQNGAVIPHSPVLPVVIWTGNSAKTGPKVQQYLDYSDRQWFLEASTHWTEQFSTDPILASRSLYSNLVEMSKRANILYTTPTIETLVNSIHDVGGGAKPSGAGGGDCLVAFFPSPESQCTALQNIHKHLPHCHVIDISIANGVEVVLPNQIR